MVRRRSARFPAVSPGPFWLWIVAATILAAGLRLHNLGKASLWIDEVYTVLACTDLSTMHRSKVLGYLPTYAALYAAGIDPPTLGETSAWAGRGVNEWLARIGACAIGIATIPLVGLASRRMLGATAAGFVAALLAVNPWHIYWSQAARFYTLEFLFYTLSLIFYFTATQRGSRARFVLAMAMFVLAFLSQPPAVVILAVFGADWAISFLRREPVRLGLFEWCAGTIAVGLCALLLKLDVSDAPEQWSRFVAFAQPQASHPPHKFAAGVVYIAGPALVVAAVGTAWSIRTSRTRLAWYLLLAAALPVILFAIWSVRNAVGSRYAFVCLFGLVGLAAVGAERLYAMLSRRAGVLAGLTPLAVLAAAPAPTLLSYYTTGHGFHPRWREAFDAVRKELRPDDVVSVRHPLLGAYYLRDAATVTFLPRDKAELDSLGRRVWVVIEADNSGMAGNGRWLKEISSLHEALDLRVPQPVGELRVYLYEPPAADAEQETLP